MWKSAGVQNVIIERCNWKLRCHVEWTEMYPETSQGIEKRVIQSTGIIEIGQKVCYRCGAGMHLVAKCLIKRNMVRVKNANPNRELGKRLE